METLSLFFSQNHIFYDNLFHIFFRKERRNFCYLSTQSFNQVIGCVRPLGVLSTYNFTAVKMFSKNCETGDGNHTASAYVKKSETLVRKEQQTI